MSRGRPRTFVNGHIADSWLSVDNRSVDLSTTVEEESSGGPSSGKGKPGVLILFSGDRPLAEVRSFGDGRLLIGRKGLPDERLSREHAELEVRADEFTIKDLDSRNGTFLDGIRVQSSLTAAPGSLLRCGHTLALLSADVRPFERGISIEGDQVIGPTLRRVLDRVGSSARSGANLLIQGESGTGKEIAAREFHRLCSHSSGPFVAVNAAAIPAEIAERLLFGTRRGAYSGANADADGYVQSADHGVLFIDEVGELAPAVQAKLLRVLETCEVLALGAVRATHVDVSLCFATNRNLRASVVQGSFRADLYHRIARPSVAMPPLRERREEIPWLIARSLDRREPKLRAHATLVEACMRRPWPGNVRELLSAVEEAADQASAEAKTTVTLRHLAADAGIAESDESPREAAEPPRAAPGRDDILRALEKCHGNIAAAARMVGLHRSTMYRAMRRLGIDVTRS